MRRRMSLVIAVTGLVLGLLTVAGPVLAANGAVKIGEANERYFFAATTVYVNVGDSVTWTNGTDVAHNVTSDSGSELASDSFGQDKTFDHAFSTGGTFAYHCTIHTYMTGRVIVLAAGVAPPATDTTANAAAVSGTGSIGIALLVLAGVGAAGLAVRRFRPQA